MADGVDRNLDKVIEFCENFEANYLKRIKSNADMLLTAASSADATLGGTEYANKASARLKTIAAQLDDAVTSGTARIRELKNEAEEQRTRKDSLEQSLD
ncbi:MAG: hypothetical protein LUF35_05925 [Lachnospiraceae bacterium]|nr:hypothetical protein [Lachnospiraceae bacterium]